MEYPKYEILFTKNVTVNSNTQYFLSPDSMEIMHTLKILCRHGDITGISEGSIVLTLRCHSAASAKALWDMYISGRLQALIEGGFVTRSLRKLCRVRKIHLKVGMAESEYLCCLQELGKKTPAIVSVHVCVCVRIHV